MVQERSRLTEENGRNPSINDRKKDRIQQNYEKDKNISRQNT